MKWWRTLWYPLTRCGRSNQQQSRSSLERRGSSGGRKWGHGVRCTCIQSDHLCSLTCDCTRPQAPALCPPETWPFVIKTKKKTWISTMEWDKQNESCSYHTVFKLHWDCTKGIFTVSLLTGIQHEPLGGLIHITNVPEQYLVSDRYFFEYGI